MEDQPLAAVPIRLLSCGSFGLYSVKVRTAVAILTAARAEAEKNMSALDRRALAQALHIIAEHADLQAQLDEQEPGTPVLVRR